MRPARSSGRLVFRSISANVEEGPAASSQLWPPGPRLSVAENFVHRVVRQRHDVERSGGAGFDIGADTESIAEANRFALGRIELGDVVGDTILQAPVVDADLAAVSCEVEVEQVALVQCGS